jgi:hypothetical protein
VKEVGIMVDDADVLEFPQIESSITQEEQLSLICHNGSELRYLTLDEYSVWDALVENSPQGSVFCKSWWLKAIDPGIHILGYFESGRLVAGIPLYSKKHFGLRVCCMPKLVQTWGVIMEPLFGKRTFIASRETHILQIFAQHLAREPIFIQAFHPANENWLPFYWNGFTQTTHYTYVLDDLSSVNHIWDELEKKQRAKIRTARNNRLRVRPCSPQEVFYVSVKTFQRQRKKHPYSLEYLQSLHKASEENDAGACFAVEDRDNRIHVAGFFVWDTKRGYFLISGQDPELRNSYAGSLLTWHLIEFASTRTAVFDFEGSMKQSIERVFRSFGAKRIPYNRITKLPSWMRVSLCLASRPQG